MGIRPSPQIFLSRLHPALFEVEIDGDSNMAMIPSLHEGLYRLLSPTLTLPALIPLLVLVGSKSLTAKIG